MCENLNKCTSIPPQVENYSIKQGDYRIHPTMSILTAAQVMTNKLNHCMLVKEVKSAKSMSSTKMWSKSNTSNKITSHEEGLIETEYGLRYNYCSVHVSDKIWWAVALYHVQLLEKDVKIYGSPRFRRAMIVTLSSQGRLMCICGYVHRTGNSRRCCYHIMDAIESTIVKSFGGTAFIIILEIILNIQERQPTSSSQ
jgi:hypothetical protein